MRLRRLPPIRFVTQLNAALGRQRASLGGSVAGIIATPSAAATALNNAALANAAPANAARAARRRRRAEEAPKRRGVRRAADAGW